MILHPLSDVVSLDSADSVSDASLVSVINTLASPVYIQVNGVPVTRIGIAAGERVLIEKDYTVTLLATTDSSGASPVGADEVLASKVAYAG